MTELVVSTRQTAMSLPENLQYAHELARSGMLPAQYKDQPANLLWALEYAEMLGCHPMMAKTGIHVIEGKPSASAGLISAMVRKAGHRLRVIDGAGFATAQLVRADDPDFTFTVTFTIEQAKAAGVLGKKVWPSYDPAMLRGRAITAVCRMAAEDSLMGVSDTSEELGATNVDEDGGLVIDGEVVSNLTRPATPIPAGLSLVPEPAKLSDEVNVGVTKNLIWVAIGKDAATYKQLLSDLEVPEDKKAMMPRADAALALSTAKGQAKQAAKAAAAKTSPSEKRTAKAAAKKAEHKALLTSVADKTSDAKLTAWAGTTIHGETASASTDIFDLGDEA